jgi:hypothetical protein
MGTLKCLDIFLERKMQWYFREINSKNIYAKNTENEEIMNLKLEGFIGIYNSWAMSFCVEKRLECHFALIALMRDKYVLHKY